MPPNSRTSSSRSIRQTADKSPGSATSATSNSARKPTASRSISTADRRPGSPSRFCRTPTRLRSPTKSKRRWTSSPRASRQGLTYVTPFDTTKFVKAAINEVYLTLIEAGVLVLIVILVFLQDWRAMLVPATTVPVTIIGAFAAMAALGFSVNLATLFAIVLAIGIVVDDAIVIVEGVSRYVEQGIPGREAAGRAMDELIGPVIGITLVLMSVFIPAAFLPGLTGQLYRQFALVIAATAFISAINAVTLKPTQCALWLRPPVPGERRNLFSRGFNAVFGAAERGYARLVGGMTRRSGAMVVLALASGRRRGLGADARADRVPAGRGPGLPDRQRATARRRLEGAHRRGHATDLGDRRERRPASTTWSPSAAFPFSTTWRASPTPASPLWSSRTGTCASSKRARICARSTGDLNRALQARDAGGRVCAAPAADPGHRQRRRLHDAGRDQERRFRLCAAAEPDRRRGQGRQRAIGAAEARHDLPGRRAAARRHRRPHQGGDARHHGRQRLFRPVGLCRIELRGPVQQVRTRVPGLHAGAARLPRDAPTTSATSRSRRATEP